MPIQLLITNVGFSLSFLLGLALGIFVFIRRRKTEPTGIVFLLLSLSICIWQASYAIGINLHDSELSRLVFILNQSAMFTLLFSSHLVLLVTNRYEAQKNFMKSFYAIAGSLVVFCTIFNKDFLLPSVSKLYLPNFFVPGPLYAVQDVFFFFLFIYLFYTMFVGYRDSDYPTRNRLKYMIIAFGFGFSISLIPEFLVYNIPVDPWPVSILGLYLIPLTYAILKYNVISINIVAKRALGYAISVTSVTMFILLIGYANDSVHNIIPNFPSWLLPLISAIIAVIIGALVWYRVKEVDLLKYQFIDVVTHKFRTPLTYIQWSLDVIKKDNPAPKEKEHAVEAIADAHARLLGLTDSLLGISNSDNSQFLYTFASENIRDIINEAASSSSNRISQKHIELDVDAPETLPAVHVDRKKLLFAVQMILDNAITYSPENGNIIVSAEVVSSYVILKVRDFGIGINEEDQKRLFSKFFRGSNAAKAHTEGLGIGLYLSKDILKHHGGSLTAHSEGQGKGSTFIFKIPVAK